MIIRNANFNDETSVIDLWNRNGLSSDPSKNNWDWLWRENPAYSEEWPLGWVLEKNGKIVGYLGNVPLKYCINGKNIRVACARGYVVDPEARSFSLKIASSFFYQKNADLLIISSANEFSAKVYKMFQAIPLPKELYNNSLFWIIESKGFLRSALTKKLGFTKFFSSISSICISPFLNSWLKISEKINLNFYKKWEGQIKLISVNEIDEKFDHFWECKKLELSNTILGVRNSKIIRWHYGKMFNSRDQKTTIFTAIEKGELLGYLILDRVDNPSILLKRYRISDLFVSMNKVEIIHALLKKAIEFANKENVHIIDTMGFPKNIHDCFLSTSSILRKNSTPFFWYYTNDKRLAKKLARSSAWYPTPFDGDSSL